MAGFEKGKGASAQLDPACLVRRLSQLKSGFHRKIEVGGCKGFVCAILGHIPMV